MGRAKITMKYIKDKKNRKSTFKQRKNGFIKKISQFTIKTGAKACLIVYDDDDDDGGNNAGPITWPEDHTIVNSTLQEYVHQEIEKTPKIFDVNDYFENKKKMVKTEITKVHKAIIDIKYPTWHPDLINMEEGELKDLIAIVNAKVDACNLKINMLKSEMVKENVVLNPTPLSVMHNIPQIQQHNNDISEMMDMTNDVGLPHNSSTDQLDLNT